MRAAVQPGGSGISSTVSVRAVRSPPRSVKTQRFLAIDSVADAIRKVDEDLANLHALIGGETVYLLQQQSEPKANARLGL